MIDVKRNSVDFLKRRLPCEAAEWCSTLTLETRAHPVEQGGVTYWSRAFEHKLQREFTRRRESFFIN